MLCEGLRRSRAFMNVQVVADNDIPGLQRRGELCTDISIESSPIHGAVDHPGRKKPVASEPGDECLRVPFAEGNIALQPLPLKRAAAQGRHVGFDRRLIDKDQPAGLTLHCRLAITAPLGARFTNVGAFFLQRQQRFFYKYIPHGKVASKGSTDRLAHPAHP